MREIVRGLARHHVAAAARLPAVHPFAAVGVFVFAPDGIGGKDQAFLRREELVVGGNHRSAKPLGGEIDEVFYTSHVTPATHAPRADRSHVRYRATCVRRTGWFVPLLQTFRRDHEVSFGSTPRSRPSVPRDGAAIGSPSAAALTHPACHVHGSEAAPIGRRPHHGSDNSSEAMPPQALTKSPGGFNDGGAGE